MRHASIETTMDTYGHLMKGAFEGMGARMEAWLKKQQNRVQTGETTREPVTDRSD